MLTGFGYDDPLRDYYGFARQIRQRWPAENDPPSDELMTLIEQAVTKCPHMADLWLQRAQLIQLCDDDSPYTPDDARDSLEAAARINPEAVEVHEALGGFCEDVLGDLERAEQAYLRAVELHGGPWAYTGLARVLLKQNRKDEAAAALDSQFCPWHDEPLVDEARAAVERGDTDF